MARSYNPTAMFRYSAMSGAGGAGASSDTYALKGDGAAVYAKSAANILLTSGDTGKITFRHSDVSGGVLRVLTDGDVTGATRCLIAQTATTDLITFIAASTCKLDGVAITDSTEGFPMDGLTHDIELTATGNLTLRHLWTNFALATAYMTTTIIQLETTISGVTEIFAFNTRSLTSITGDKGTVINLLGVVAEDWVTL